LKNVSYLDCSSIICRLTLIIAIFALIGCLINSHIGIVYAQIYNPLFQQQQQEQPNFFGQYSFGSAVTNSPTAAAANPNSVPNQFIVVLKDQGRTDMVYTMANEIISRPTTAANILDVYDSTIKGFTVSFPNQQEFDSLANDPRVAFVEQDKVVYGQHFFSTSPYPNGYELSELTPYWQQLQLVQIQSNQLQQQQLLNPLLPAIQQLQPIPIPEVEQPYMYVQRLQ
jgi:hypothetical protein